MKMFKKLASFVVLTAMLVAIFVQAVPVVGSAASYSGAVVLSGSTSVEPLMKAYKEAFESKNPKVTISLVNVTGSGSGISDAKAGKVDFGMSSKSLSADEKKVLSYTEIALDGVAIIVNKANSLTNITNEQLYDIYTGKIKKWSEVSSSLASLGDIAVVHREANSGTRGCFEDVFKNDFKKALTKDYDKSANSSIQTTTGGVKATVSSSPSAIGYMSLGDMDDTVKAVNFNNVAPSKETVANGTYEFNRPFVLCRLNTQSPSSQAKAFLNWIMSEEGQDIAEKKGFVKMPKTRINVSSVALNKYAVVLAKGKTVKLTATVLPKNATTKAVSYSSSDANVATVNPSTGLVKAVSKGTATITVKSDNNGATATCKVTVK